MASQEAALRGARRSHNRVTRSSGHLDRIAACCDVADRSVIPDRVEGGVPAIEWREVCMSEKERCRIMGAVIEVMELLWWAAV